MASHNNGRRTITPEELASRKLEIARIKAEAEEKKQIKIDAKAAFFKKTPGKLLKGFSGLVAIFCVVFIVDGTLSKKYTELEIKSSSEDIVQLYKGGWIVNSTFNWVYLDNQEQFGIHMHHDQFDIIKEVGVIELGNSPIFNTPSNFRIKNILGTYDYSNFSKDYNYLYFVPFVLFFLSMLWIFSKPQKSFQWIMFGYFHMVVTPIVLLVLVLKIMSYLNGVGMYEINVGELNI